MQNKLSDAYACLLGVRQGEIVSPSVFSMFLCDIEDIFIDNGLSGINVNMFKLVLILYADDIVIFANSKEELQLSLDALYEYCQRWKMSVHINKTKVIVFKKSGRLTALTKCYYTNEELEIVGKFTYLNIVFSTGGSFFRFAERTFRTSITSDVENEKNINTSLLT